MKRDATVMNRREWLKVSAASAGMWAMPALARAGGVSAGGNELRLAMCDWTMGRIDVSCLELAKRIGLKGMQISMGSEADNLPLRRPEVQRTYLDASREQGVAIASLALTVLNDVPLMSEPRAGVWLIDAIEVAYRMKAPVVLLPFFGKGLLREENKEDMRRVTQVLKEAAPKAEKAGVILGLETYLRAEALLKIIKDVGSRSVQVYYDVFNADHEKYDVVKEIKMLGKKQICEVHFKEGRSLLGETKKIDWRAAVKALKQIKYDGWCVLETQSPNDVLTDTQKNMGYIGDLFATTPV